MKRTPKRLRALFCVAAMACAESAQAATALTEANANAPISVRAGETLDLRLSENPSTGYVWSLAFDPPDAAAATGSQWTANSGAIGAPGVRDFSIAIRQAGKLVIRAKNWRSWEGEASVTKRLEFRLDAR